MRGRPLCLVCLMFIIFCGRYQVHVPADSIFADGKQEMEIVLTGQVYRIEQTSEYQLLYLKDNSITYQNQNFFESNIFVYDKEFHNVKIGNTVQVFGEANAFFLARNTGNFDARNYYARLGFFGNVYGDDVVVVSEKTFLIRQWLFELKCKWSNLLKRVFDKEDSGIMQAILLGEKKHIEVDIKELYRKNGISHILAISGLHITFIGMGLYQFLRKGGLGLGLSSVFSISLLMAYVWLTGMSISAVRAFLMLTIRVGADLCGRNYDMPTSWLLSGAIMIAWHPEYILDAGFLLSYGAVAGVIFVAPAVRKLFPKITSIVKGLDVGVGVGIILFPILLHYYYELSLYSVLLNLIVVPLTTVLLGCGIVGSLICLFSFPIGNVVFAICKWVLRLFEKLPGKSIVTGEAPLWFFILFYCCVAVLLFAQYLNREERKRIKCYLASIFIGLMMLSTQFYDNSGQVEIVFLDVGQGDCIFIKGPTGETYLVDGGSSDVTEVGKYRILPFLKSQGVNHLDYVFVTHGDFDHYSGVEELLGSDIEIHKLVFPSTYKNEQTLLELGKQALEYDARVTYIDQQEQIQEEELSITCIYPYSTYKGTVGNESSLVLSVTYGEWDILLTGDVEEKGEETLTNLLVERGQKYEVLKVAHHGSKNSSKENFLQTICPEIAIVSAGENNSYGHPHEETMDRLRKKRCKILNTAECGEIRIVIDEDGANLLTFF